VLVRVEALYAGYGATPVLRDVSLVAHPGEAIAVIGPNGAGKTTLLKAIVGMLRPTRGQVHYEGRRLNGLRAFQTARLGLVYVPAERELFPTMTVLENLELGAYLRPGANLGEDLERVHELFPVLAQRSEQKAGTMSGGEQQMLAIGRALMARPRLLLLDEPSMGLAPVIVEQIFETIREVNRLGTTILLVEQNAAMALEIAHRGYVLETGAVVLTGTAAELAANADVRRAYLGE
jgi:branched-chain amino acid transport system ATP-binding protein